MNKLVNFFKKNSDIIIALLILFIFFKQCGLDNKISKNIKTTKELIDTNNKKDSILEITLNNLNKKMDSTLISNYAVINSNNETNNVIKKQQQVVVKVIPAK